MKDGKNGGISFLPPPDYDVFPGKFHKGVRGCRVAPLRPAATTTEVKQRAYFPASQKETRG